METLVELEVCSWCTTSDGELAIPRVVSIVSWEREGEGEKGLRYAFAWQELASQLEVDVFHESRER